MNGKIEDWSVIGTTSARSPEYGAPEQMGIRVVGKFGDGRFGERSDIITSRIVSAKGKIVTTKSGSTYELGEPSKEYLAWMKEKGIRFDPETPIRRVRG